jgi:Zn-dependent protease with chaperone function
MDFFAAQDQARRRSRLLTTLFGLSVVGVILVIYVPVNFALTAGRFDPAVLAGVAIPVAAVILGASWWRLRSLRAGGARVALLLGGRRILPNTTSPKERQLLNLVEEMALASGTPVPPVFVLDREEGINAFAAGYSIHDAAVAVTRGCLERLGRDELQGVIAHEFSHILNGDMRLNIRMVGLLFGLLVLTVIGRGLLRTGAHRSARRNDAGAAVVMAGLVLLIVGYIGIYFGKLIKAAVSREREYLADAAAVQFTRNPEGVAGALKKIGSTFPGSRIEDHHAEELSHLFFAAGMRERYFSLFRTHPPLERRIRRVDPAWDGSYDVEARAAAAPSEESGSRGSTAASAPAGSSAAAVTLGVPAAAVLASLGAPDARHLDLARALLARIPDRLRDAAQDPEGAPALLYATLLAPEPGPTRTRQLREVAAQDGAGMAARVEALAGDVATAGRDARLALVDLALPTLGALPDVDASHLRRTAHRLLQAGGEVGMLEYAVVHILDRHLPPGRERAVGVREKIHSLQPIRTEVALVLSALAHSGSRTGGSAVGEEARAAGAAEAAFAAAVSRLPESLHDLTLTAAQAMDLPAVDAALRRLERAAMPVRQRVVDACVHCVAADGLIISEEAEGLRAVAEALDCPLPPLPPVGAVAREPVIA